MTGNTAALLASLSHGLFWLIWPLPIIFGAAAVGVRRLQARAGTEVNTRAFAGGRLVRWISNGLFAASVVVFGFAFCHFGCAMLVAQGNVCHTHSKQLGMATMMYAADYDEHLPASAHWEEAIASRVKSADTSSSDRADRDPFHCPAASSVASYGMNAVLGSRNESDLESPADTVLLFDADAPRHSFAGGAKDLARKRHNSAPNVVFADGHVKSANSYVVDKLGWMLKVTEAPRQTGTRLPRQAE